MWRCQPLGLLAILVAACSAEPCRTVTLTSTGQVESHHHPPSRLAALMAASAMGPCPCPREMTCSRSPGWKPWAAPSLASWLAGSAPAGQQAQAPHLCNGFWSPSGQHAELPHMSWQGQTLQVDLHRVCSRWEAEGLEVKVLLKGCVPGCIVLLKVPPGVQKCSERGRHRTCWCCDLASKEVGRARERQKAGHCTL